MKMAAMMGLWMVLQVGGSTDEELLKRLDAAADVAKGEKTFEVANALGKLYYDHGRYLRSAEFFKQVLEKKPGFETRETRIMLAKAYFLAGNSEAAAQEFQKVLKADPNNGEALYGHASVLFDVHGDQAIALEQVRRELTLFLRGSQDVDAQRMGKIPQAKALLALTERAIKAGGTRKMSEARAIEELQKADAMLAVSQPPAAPPSLSPQMIEAVKNTERTPEFEQGMAKLTEASEDALAQGEFQVALDGYKRIVPFQPENGRARAGMAWALVSLNKQPMAERVWGVAVGSEPGALDRLGDTLSAKGDVKGAHALWQKLIQAAPDYARRSSLQAKIK